MIGSLGSGVGHPVGELRHPASGAGGGGVEAVELVVEGDAGGGDRGCHVSEFDLAGACRAIALGPVIGTEVVQAAEASKCNQPKGDIR